VIEGPRLDPALEFEFALRRECSLSEQMAKFFRSFDEIDQFGV
jgi:hypothetical protein